MVSMPRSHGSLTFHQVGDNLEFFGIDVAISIQIKHLERNFEMSSGSAQHGQEEYVVRKRYQPSRSQLMKNRAFFQSQIQVDVAHLIRIDVHKPI